VEGEIPLHRKHLSHVPQLFLFQMKKNGEEYSGRDCFRAPFPRANGVGKRNKRNVWRTHDTAKEILFRAPEQSGTF
jgi:hypothetical protein